MFWGTFTRYRTVAERLDARLAGLRVQRRLEGRDLREEEVRRLKEICLELGRTTPLACYEVPAVLQRGYVSGRLPAIPTLEQVREAIRIYMAGGGL